MLVPPASREGTHLGSQEGGVSDEFPRRCRWARDFGSHASEAPRPLTPCHVKSGTVVSRNATRPCGCLCDDGDFP